MTNKAELWVLVREWLNKQKHISQRVQLEYLEYGPPYAELCTVGNRYTYAYIYDDRIEFVSIWSITDAGDEARTDHLLTVYAHDPLFFKKIKEQLLKMLHGGQLNWPMYER
jgi:hypothetical protein